MVDNMSFGKKQNPLFSRPKKDSGVGKLLDGVGVEKKRVIRKDWNPRLAKDDTVEELSVKPSLASNELKDEVAPVAPVERSEASGGRVRRVEPTGEPVRSEPVSEPVKPVRVPARVVAPLPVRGGSGDDKRRNSIFLGRDDAPVKPSDGGVKRKVVVPVRRGLEDVKPEVEHKDQRPTVLRAKSGVQVEDWSDDTSTDTDKGLGGANDKGYREPELGAGFHLTERDITIIRFLARYRYAYNFQIARLVRTSVKGIRPRLRTLSERGFIRKQVITGAQHIWLSTKAGNLVADIDLVAIKKGEVSWVTVAHTLGLVNIGVELETGGENLLKEDVWPLMNNVDVRGRVRAGDRVVTEKEIRAGQQKWRMNRTTAEMRVVTEEALNDFGDPVGDPVTGEISYPDSPETLDGNEGLFVIYSPSGEHIPDMVVSRGRDKDGKALNVAIELELHEKTHADWRRILRAYKEYGELFDKVVYFTQKRNIANQLMKINNNNGDVLLPPEKFIVRKYIPKNEREPFWG